MQHSWISTSFHISKLFLSLRPEVTLSNSVSDEFLHFIVTFFLCLVVLYATLFENDRTISRRKVCTHKHFAEIISDIFSCAILQTILILTISQFLLVGACVMVASAVGGHKCLGDIYQVLFRSPPTVMDSVGE